ncbi:MAG: hypothetical protein WD845_08410 [Pirellulales bacterium]
MVVEEAGQERQVSHSFSHRLVKHSTTGVNPVNRIIKSFLGTAPIVWSAVDSAGLIPGQSRVLIQTSIALVPQYADDLQPLPTGPLSASISRNGPLQGSWDLDANAIFHNPNSGTVNLGYIRGNLGNSSFGGDVTFTYDFTLSDPGPVRFDYDVTFTTTDDLVVNGNLHPRIWWAMQSMSIGVGSQSAELPPFSFNSFPAQPSPITQVGTTTFNVPAGFHQLQIRLPAGAASGDFPGVRSAMGEIQFTIVPEPATATLALAACAALCLCGKRRKR